MLRRRQVDFHWIFFFWALVSESSSRAFRQYSNAGGAYVIVLVNAVSFESHVELMWFWLLRTINWMILCVNHKWNRTKWLSIHQHVRGDDNYPRDFMWWQRFHCHTTLIAMVKCPPRGSAHYMLDCGFIEKANLSLQFRPESTRERTTQCMINPMCNDNVNVIH